MGSHGNSPQGEFEIAANILNSWVFQNSSNGLRHFTQEEKQNSTAQYSIS